jgi:hypothetical protein
VFDAPRHTQKQAPTWDSPPGAKDPEEIKVLVKAIQPKPFNPWS